MNSYGKRVLNLLLDKYERSKSYRANDSGRRVMLRFEERVLPKYFDRMTARHRLEYNAACLWLAEQGIIEIEWERFQEGSVITRVILNLAAAERAYELLGRTPLQDKERRLQQLVSSYAFTESWMEQFKKYIIERLEQGQSVASYFDLDDTERTRAILKCLQQLTAIKQETPKRVFSSRVLGDSKLFARLEGTICRIISDFGPYDNSLSRDELLSEFGLVSNPQYVYISGGITLAIGDQVIDLSGLAPGIALPAALLNTIAVRSVTGERLVTIENLTTFYQYCLAVKGRDVVVYLGGYHNRVRRQLLLEIALSHNLPFYHWGDIDAGGYDILRHLRRETGLQVQPWRMDSKTLSDNRDLAHPLSRRDITRLKQLTQNEFMADVKEDIDKILELGLKLEQEVLPV